MGPDLVASAGRSGVDERRRGELAENLARIRERMSAACAATGRDSADVTLIAVTKTYPASDVLLLAELGVSDIGENRDQEAAPKAAAVAACGVDVRWHFVGRLQRNKCRSVAAYAEVVHSVDSVRLARALGGAATGRDRPLAVMVQVGIDGDPSRGGALPDTDDADRSVAAVARAVAGSPALRLAGLMGVAPLDWAPEPAFARLAAVADRVRAEYPEATALSAGMSGDLEAAIAHGATHVRIGSALLGMRERLR